MPFMRWWCRNWNIIATGGRKLMNLGETFQWLMLLYGVKCRFVDCCCRHEGEFSSRKLGPFSDLQDPLYMTSGDIEKFTLVIVLSSGLSFRIWQYPDLAVKTSQTQSFGRLNDRYP
jgi:hypothetical protein